MNKKMLGIGILLIVVIGLIAIGRNLNHPLPTAPLAEAPQDANVASTAESSKPAPKSPQKATAKPKASVALPQAAPVDIILDQSTEFARTYEDILQRYIKNAADFDGHFIVAKWSCGQNCVMGGLIDKQNGKVYVAPIEHPGGVRMAPSFVFYSLDNNKYRIINGDRIETYSFNNNLFTLVSVDTI